MLCVLLGMLEIDSKQIDSIFLLVIEQSYEYQ